MKSEDFAEARYAGLIGAYDKNVGGVDGFLDGALVVGFLGLIASKSKFSKFIQNIRNIRGGLLIY